MINLTYHIKTICSHTMVSQSSSILKKRTFICGIHFAFVIIYSIYIYFLISIQICFIFISYPLISSFMDNFRKRIRMPNLFSFDFYDQIANKVTLEDPNGNKFEVVEKEINRVYLIDGSKKVLKFCKLIDVGQLLLIFLRMNHLLIDVKDIFLKKVQNMRPFMKYSKKKATGNKK